jgi:F0F1-type ATP synthase membrane subunit a
LSGKVFVIQYVLDFIADKKEETMPKTKLGKWSGMLLAVFLVFLIASLLFLHLLEFRRGSAELLIPATIAFIAGISAFVTGLISLLKFKDRSVVVILAIIFGFFATLICAMEMVELIGTSSLKTIPAKSRGFWHRSRWNAPL